MKKTFSFFTILAFLLLFSCKKDTVEADFTTNLEVLVLSFENEAIQGAEVKTDPETETLITDASGVVFFNDIPPGEYTVLISFPLNPDPFIPNGIISDVTVTEGSTESVSFVSIEGPNPIMETPLNIDLLLSSTYNTLREALFYDNDGYSLYWGDIGSEIVYVNNSAPMQLIDLDRYNFNTTNLIINDVWGEHYKVIRNTNLGIEAIMESSYESPSNRSESELEAEFRFLRALLYFNLVKVYGNPVLVSSTNFNGVFEQDIDGVYSLIEEDLKFAETNLTTSKVAETASTYAAQTLLGKFYLYLGGFPSFQTDKYQLAINQFEKVEGQYSLEENYVDVFSVINEVSNSEVIFTIPFDEGDDNTGGNTGVRWGPLGYALNDYLHLDKSFIEDYFNNPETIEEPVSFPLAIDDERFLSNIATFTQVSGDIVDDNDIGNWRPYKFINDLSVIPEANNSSENFPLLRYADVLLMLAEAENAINGPTQKAYDAVNAVINRSCSIGKQLPTGLSQQDFLLEILKQRKLEFCFEGQYKDDLIRNELLESVISKANIRNPNIQRQFEEHKYIWPIPQSEINLNSNISQNAGY